MPLPKLQLLACFSIEVVSPAGDLRSIPVRLPRGFTAAAALDAVCLASPGVSADSTWLMDVWGGRVMRLFLADEARKHREGATPLVPRCSFPHLHSHAHAQVVDTCCEAASLTLRAMPFELAGAAQDAGGRPRRLVHMVHSLSDTGAFTSLFGEPLLFYVGLDETLAELKPRLALRLGLPPAEVAAWTWCTQPTWYARPDRTLLDGDGVCSALGPGPQRTPLEPVLALQHEDRRPPRRHASSGALVIRG